MCGKNIRMNSENEPGRRERKKAGTRAALLASSKVLFETKGFADTTVHQIAEAADVSERTFFRYFRSKDDLLLPGIASFFNSITAEFESNGSRGQPLEALLASVEAVVTRNFTNGENFPLPIPEPWNDSLASRSARAFMEWERNLSEVMRAKISAADPDLKDLDLVAAVTTRCGIAAMRSTLEYLQRSGVANASNPDVALGALRRAFELASSLGTLPDG